MIFFSFLFGIIETLCTFATHSLGGMPERSNGTVLKTVERDERSVGSNPTPSSNKNAQIIIQ